MIYDVNSSLFRSFLASGGGSHGGAVRWAWLHLPCLMAAAQCMRATYKLLERAAERRLRA
jgi:hypothetical protein